MNTPKQHRTDAAFDLAAVDGGASRRYLICSTPRSGSTLLGRLLEATGRMGVPYEYLNIQVHAKPMARRLGVPPIPPGPYLRAVERVRTTSNGVFGLKAHFHQIAPLLRYPATAQFMASAALIWIRRRDLLGQAISYYRAASTSIWSLAAGAAAPPPVEFSYERIHAGVKGIVMENAYWEAWFASHDRPCHHVWYEDLVEAPDRVCQAVCRLVLGEEIDRVFALAQSDIVKMRDDTTEQWRERFIAMSRAGAWPAPAVAGGKI